MTAERTLRAPDTVPIPCMQGAAALARPRWLVLLHGLTLLALCIGVAAIWLRDATDAGVRRLGMLEGHRHVGLPVLGLWAARVAGATASSTTCGRGAVSAAGAARQRSVQTTLRNVGLPFAQDLELGGKDARLGLSLNNSPGVQDAISILPARGLPVPSTDGTLLDPASTRHLANRVVGLSAFGLYDSNWHGEVGS